jgi:predicted MPP superfamily phosphohydrolase
LLAYLTGMESLLPLFHRGPPFSYNIESIRLSFSSPSFTTFNLSGLYLLKLKKRIAKWLLIGLLLVLAYAVLVEPFWVRTKIVEVKDKNFVDFFKQYKTVLISDIHVSRLGIREKILLNKIKKISPDIIFITGDFVSWDGDYEKAFGLITKLKSKVGIWAVLGDSDYQNSRKACIFCHAAKFQKKSFPVQFLRNQTVYLPVGQSRIAISGIEQNEKDTAGYEPFLRGNKGCPEIL